MKPIEIKNLGKKYTITHESKGGHNYTALRDVITDSAKNFLKRFTGKNTGTIPEKEEIWALKDISFDVEQGDKIGIIGRNGAGKSTMLKILSRITEPTERYAKIRGRVSSLLEVGTGFHSELTGRENIYLNGAILGMKKNEIDKKFDEIVDFSGVEKFLDTPVKRYSSGMQVRLAFAVAAHLEPEILLVDEVLAVGDAEFQKKCLGKMDEVSKQEGRTIIFVSHNMSAIRQLCSKAVLLEDGKTSLMGDASSVVQKYLSNTDKRGCSVDLRNYKSRFGTGGVFIEYARIENSQKIPCSKFSIGDDIHIVFSVSPEKDFNLPVKIVVFIRTSEGLPLSYIINTDSGFETGVLSGDTTFSVIIRDVRFYPDTYHLSLSVITNSGIDTYDGVMDCLSFDITDGGRLTSRLLPRSLGLLFLTPEWSSKGSS